MSRFVLLEHRWNGVHWDFMLETDEGPLRTWSLDSEVASGRDIQARGLPDHRPFYLEYQGKVSGGRGTVRRIDEGTYERLVWTDDLVRIRLEGNQLFGPVELRRAVSGDDSASGSRADWVIRFGNLD